MDVTPQELRSSEIKDSWRGYDRDEVDDLLERAAVTIESLTQKLQEAASRPVSTAPQAAPAPAAVATEVPLPSSREDADML
ncbi:MAG TPA: DivIVA domain-containing protein, partial [Acidimicrobiia bacterium]|nr:DivIVA domain-containing protein [Acidimicrobiia bacterium]